MKSDNSDNNTEESGMRFDQHGYDSSGGNIIMELIGIIILLGLACLIIKILAIIVNWLWDVGFFEFVFLKIVLPSVVGIIVSLTVWKVTGEANAGIGGGAVCLVITFIFAAREY